MRKFAFTLQPMLGLKYSQEKQQRSELGALTRRLHALAAERDAMLERRGCASQDYGARLAAGMTAAETQRYTDYFRMMKETLEEQDRLVAEAERLLDESRNRLTEILREIKTLENLRSRQFEQYQAEVQAEQERTIGDYVSYQTARKTTG